MRSFQTGSQTCTCRHRFHDTHLIAVTGAPGAGKTAVLEMALRSLCTHVGVLPEATAMVLDGGFPRDGGPAVRCAAERAIFHLQRELETLVVDEGRVAVALCDRGTVDGLAYWPGSAQSYWRQLGTTLERELSRYAAVIHLRAPGPEQGQRDGDGLETASTVTAAELDRRILAAWERHPNRIVVGSAEEFLHKATLALELVRTTLPRCCMGRPAYHALDAVVHPG
ncbi:MAG: AAA family ATPase [Myxococcota bacterium]